MATDPQSLFAQANCYACYASNEYTASLMELALLLAWAGQNKQAALLDCSGTTDPNFVTPGTLAVVVGTLTFSQGLFPPPSNPVNPTQFALYWGLTPGGPYPNGMLVPNTNFANVLQGSTFNFVGNIWYFVMQGANNFKQCSVFSNEVSMANIPPSGSQFLVDPQGNFVTDPQGFKIISKP